MNDNLDQNQPVFEAPDESASKVEKKGAGFLSKKMFFFILMLVIGVVLYIGSSGISKKYFNEAQKGELVEPNRSASITSDPNTKEYLGDVPPNFPDFPIYQGVKIETSRHTKDESGEHFDVSMKSQDSIKNVMQWYFQVLQKDEWTLLTSENIGEEGVEQSMALKKGNTKVGMFGEEHDGTAEFSANITVGDIKL